MKTTIDVPDDLYRLVKAKSALEGRAVRTVALELFQRYVQEGLEQPAPDGPSEAEGDHPPAWFGVLGKTAKRVDRHDIESIRASVARGVATERKL